MQNTKSKNEFQEIVELDGADIYLGNLNTVDTDLKLPAKGVRGSDIQWRSGETLFISHEGKVTRPTPGVGDRVVPLTATLTCKDAVFQRIFAVTVIEQPSRGNISAVHPIRLTVGVHEAPRLPSVVIVEKDTGMVTTARVSWDPIDKKALDSAGTFTVSGKVADSDFRAEAEICVTEAATTGKRPSEELVHSFPCGAVSLMGDSLFLKAQDLFLEYLLQVDDDQMLYNFRSAAGLDTKGAPPMTGWDSPDCNLKGHTTGHYLSALSLAFAATRDERIHKKIVYLVDELAACQDAMSARPECREGFLSAYSEEQFDLLEEYTTYPKIWAPYYTLHKIMAGLLDSYNCAGIQRGLTVCSRLGDWVHRRLSALPEEQLKKMWSLYVAGEFGGMMEVLVNLYFATGNKDYLTTAQYFINDKLYFPMSENIDTLEDMHVNQHIPQIIGAIKLYEAQGDERYFEIAKNFWDIVIRSHTYGIGGIGENEMFKRSGKIAACLSEKTAESCATYNMLKLTKELYSYTPQKHYMDYYERALFNHILSACDLSGPSGGTTYFMPLISGSRKAFNTSENTCCHGTGLENPFKLTKGIYFHNKNSLYVNLYIPSKLVWKENGVTVRQDSISGDLSNISMRIDGHASFTLRLRIPDWANGQMKVSMNHVTVTNGTIRNGYLEINREWDYDTIETQMPLSFRFEQTPDDPTLVAIFYGPCALVALADEKTFPEIIFAENELDSKIKTVERGKRYDLDGISLMPLNQISQETFSAYFRLRP